MNEFNEMLKGVDAKTLEKGMQQANAFVKTKEGKAMLEKFKTDMPGDKDSLMKMLSENPDIVKSIETFFKN